MLFSMGGCCICWIGVCVASGIYNTTGSTNDSAARAFIAMIFLFGAVFSVGITPLQALYPVEVLSFELRAKGMAFSSLSVNAATLLNQFAWPISLKKIGWKTYFVFLGWCIVQTIIFYYFLPETKQRTLEELDELFADKNPVKASLRPHRVAVTAGKEVITMDDE